MMKLSTMWNKAAKELKQVQGTFGDAYKKEACARGALFYYLSKGKTVNPNKVDFILRMKLEKQEKIFLRAYGQEVTLNDEKGWTFKQFAEAARMVGV